jgi:zinc protease
MFRVSLCSTLSALFLFSSPAFARKPLEPTTSPLPSSLRYELDNGLRIVLVPNPRSPVLELQLGFRAGSAADPPGREGTASLLSRLITSGLEALPEQALAAELARLGGTISADVSSQAFTIGGQVPTFAEADVRRFLDLFFDCALENPLPRDVLAREKALRAGLFSKLLDNPDALADIAARLLALGDNPHGRPTFGTPTSIERISRDDLAFYRDRIFHPKHAVLVIGGAFRPESMLTWLESRLGRWSPPLTLEPGVIPGRYLELCLDGRCLDNPGATPNTAPPRSDLVHIVIDGEELPQVPFRLTSTAPFTLLQPEWSAYQLGAFVLGGDFTSRLMQSLRVREGLTYGAHFSTDPSAYSLGTMTVSTDATPDALTRAITLAKDELVSISHTPIPHAELERARKMLLESFAFKFETVSHTVEQFLGLELATLPTSWLASWKSRLEPPTSTDVQAALTSLEPSNFSLIVVGPASLGPTLSTLGNLRTISARALLDHGLSEP